MRWRKLCFVDTCYKGLHIATRTRTGYWGYYPTPCDSTTTVCVSFVTSAAMMTPSSVVFHPQHNRKMPLGYCCCCVMLGSLRYHAQGCRSMAYPARKRHHIVVHPTIFFFVYLRLARAKPSFASPEFCTIRPYATTGGRALAQEIRGTMDVGAGGDSRTAATRDSSRDPRCLFPSSADTFERHHQP